jgi:hypothetical protein
MILPVLIPLAAARSFTAMGMESPETARNGKTARTG